MKLWKPEVYQGRRKMRAYFEGWYYKMVDGRGRNVVAIIPGVSFEKDGSAHAFIQVAGSGTGPALYFKYPLEAFRYSEKILDVTIGGSTFKREGLDINACSDINQITGSLKFSGLSPWPVKPGSPGAMGWYAFVPFMQCYHGVVSMDHEIYGSISINGKSINMDGGRGYIEKDWGKSFPRYHIWMQTNHFDVGGASLMCSIANIPWMKRHFDGFIAGFLLNGSLHRFATYTGARLAELEIKADSVSIAIEARNHILEIHTPRQGGIELAAPASGEMIGKLRESLKAVIDVKLFANNSSGKVLLFEGTGSNAGLEIAGNIEQMKNITR